MKLIKLISDIQIKKIINKDPLTGTEITGITFDSRKVEKGNMFVAFQGENFDGHEYIDAAIKKGAAAVLCDNKNFCPNISIPAVLVKNSRKTLAHVAAKFYDHPSQKLTLIGITGTDGKTTTCEIIYRILQHSGKKAGIISTLGARIGNEIIKTGLHTTTPNALKLQSLLAKMVNDNTDIAILETSSHGLAQYRVEACDFDIGVVTNLASDHLDYHKTLGEYKKAKAQLLKYIVDKRNDTTSKKKIILNRNDENFDYFNHYKTDENISFGVEVTADFKATGINISKEGVEFTVTAENSQYLIQSKLLGKYNIQNILASLAVGRGLNISWQVLQTAIASIPTVLGRLEKIEHQKGNFSVYIDFAHTPQGLESVLKTVKNFTKNNIHVIFGCPGARDKSKRKPMGEIAAEYADKIYLTADDPRHEPVEKIIKQIAQGCTKHGKKKNIDYFEIPDRKQAIEKAILSAQSGDAVIACGKAHEESMATGNEEIPWDEYEVVKDALNKR